MKIKYVGLRQGEKLHEILIGVNENVRNDTNKDITQIKVLPISIDDI